MAIETFQIYTYMVYLKYLVIQSRDTSFSQILYVAKTLKVVKFCFEVPHKQLDYLLSGYVPN